MGIYTDLASSTQIPSSGRVGLDRSSAGQLLNKAAMGDLGVRAGFGAQSAVTRIAAHTGTPTGGNYTLTVSIPTLGVEFTTASIAYNAAAATIETAIDTASPASVPNGDLAVTEEGSAGLSDGYIDITAEDAVANMPVHITINDVDMAGGSPGEVTLTTAGQGNRKAAQALFDMNVVSGALWTSGLAVSGLTRPASVGQTRPRYQLIRDLAIMAAVEDGSDSIYDAVMALYPKY